MKRMMTSSPYWLTYTLVHLWPVAGKINPPTVHSEPVRRCYRQNKSFHSIVHWICACSFNSVFSWQLETLWAAGVPGTFQVALCNQRKVVVQALGINSRWLSLLIGSDGSEGADPERRSCSSLARTVFFILYRPIMTVKSDVFGRCFYFFQTRKATRLLDKQSRFVWKADCSIDERIWKSNRLTFAPSNRAAPDWSAD